VYVRASLEENAASWRAGTTNAHRTAARPAIERLTKEVLEEVLPERLLAAARLPRGKLHIVIEQPSGRVVQESDLEDDAVSISTDAANSIYATYGLWERELPFPWKLLLRHPPIRHRFKRRLKEALGPQKETLIATFPDKRQLRLDRAGKRKEFVVPRRNNKGWRSNSAWAKAIRKMCPDLPITAKTLDNYLSGKTDAYDTTREAMAKLLEVDLKDLPQ
jgi:hypothetical protein